MFRYFSPGVIAFSLAVVAVLSAIGAAQKKIRRAERAAKYGGGGESSGNEGIAHSVMRNIADRHKDCTAEVVNMWVQGIASTQVDDMDIGSPLKLALDEDDNVVAYTVFRQRLGQPLIPNGSHLVQMLKEDIDYDAYLGGRECLANSTIASIIVFYKMEGVGPTHVNIQ